MRKGRTCGLPFRPFGDWSIDWSVGLEAEANRRFPAAIGGGSTATADASTTATAKSDAVARRGERFAEAGGVEGSTMHSVIAWVSS